MNPEIVIVVWRGVITNVAMTKNMAYRIIDLDSKEYSDNKPEHLINLEEYTKDKMGGD